MGEEGKYQPRLCKVFKWEDFNGYGFNLHAERGKAGQYIGKVDADSPAEAAGLKQGDRIVEVDGMNIGNENHQQVVSRIKAGGDRTSLLVVDNETDKYFKEQRIVVKSDMPQVLSLSSEKQRQIGTDTNEETGENGEINGVTSAAIEQNGTRNNEIDLDSDAEDTPAVVTEDRIETTAVETVQSAPINDEVPDSNVAEFNVPPPPTEDPDIENNLDQTPEPVHDTSSDSLRNEVNEQLRDPSPEPPREPSPEPVRDPSPEPVRAPTPEPVRVPTPEPVRAPTPEPVRAPTPEPVRVPTPEPVRAPTPEPVKPPTPEPVKQTSSETNGAQTNDDPIMRMSAKEMREQLAAKKKADAKSKKMGFKDKYEIFQRL